MPDGYPDAEAIEVAKGWAAEANVDLDVAAQVRRFRDHAATKDRRERNWPAAWRQWVGIACETAPPRAAASGAELAQVTWLGPPEIWEAVVESRPKNAGEGFAVSWLTHCRWDEDGRELVTDNVGAFRKLEAECAKVFRRLQVNLRLAEGRAA